MITTIAFKELLLAVKTIRFVVIVLVCCLFIPVSVAVVSTDYLAELADYKGRVALEDRRENGLDDELSVFRPVPPLSALYQGISTKSVNAVKLVKAEWNKPMASATQSPVHSLFPTVDMGFIVGVILSALAIMLSFDSISGEKADATLRMIMCNSIARSKVIFGKWIGLSTAMIIPFVLGFIISILLFFIITGGSLAGDDAVALAVSFVFSLVYLALFVLIGITVSALTRRPGTAIFTGLGVWGVLVILVPNFAVAIAQTVVPVDPPQRVDRELRLIVNEMYQKIREENIVLTDEAVAGNWDRSKITLVRRENEWPKKASERKRAIELEYDYWNALDRQELTGRYISLLSPYGCINEIQLLMANTGPDAQRAFMRDAYDHGDRFFNTIFGDLNTYPTDDMIKAYEEYRYTPISLVQRLLMALPAMAVMLISMAVLMMATVIVFNRYDPR